MVIIHLIAELVLLVAMEINLEMRTMYIEDVPEIGAS